MEDLVVPQATEPYGRAVWGRARPEGRPETPPLCCTAPPHGTPALIEQTKKSHRSLGLGNVHTHVHAHTCVHVYTRCTLVCVHTHMCSCVLMYTRYMLVCAHVYTRGCTRLYMPMHIHLQTRAPACAHTYMQTYLHLFTCTHIQAHIHDTHTHMCTNVPFILTLLKVVKLVSTSWV